MAGTDSDDGSVGEKKLGKKAGKRLGKKKAGKRLGKKKAGKRLGKKKAGKRLGKKRAGKRLGKKAGGRSATPVSPRLEVGAKAPAFALADEAGDMLRSSALAGKRYVLYFYPKDDTPGCTREACGFTDELAAFRAAGVRVIGVSPDSTESHRKFIDKHSIEFTLLADTEKTLATAYGVWALKKNYGREFMGVVRSTFLVGTNGLIERAWHGVRVDGHVAEVKQALSG